jgi:hypothetical protein
MFLYSTARGPTSANAVARWNMRSTSAFARNQLTRITAPPHGLRWLPTLRFMPVLRFSGPYRYGLYAGAVLTGPGT